MTERQRTIGVILLALTGATVLGACAGLDLGDWIRVQTPHAVQVQAGLPASLSLNEAEAEYRAWMASITDVGTRWQTSIERSREIRTQLSQLLLQVGDRAGPTLAGIPALAPVVPLLTLLGGWFLRRPGDVSRADMAREKEDSYNAGLKRGREAVYQGLSRVEGVVGGITAVARQEE